MKAKTKLYVIIIALAIVVGLICAVVDFTAVHPTPTRAVTTVEFLYEGAANGLDPNGCAFEGSSVITEQIVASALQATGLQDKYAASEVLKSVSVQGYYPENILSTLTDFDSVLKASDAKEITTKNYYPTKYSVTLYNNFDSSITSDNLTALLDAIVSAYYTDFVFEYSKVPDFDGLSAMLDTTGYDYIHQIDMLMANISLIQKFCEESYKIKPTFVSNGMIFEDLALKCRSIVNTYMNKVEVNITMNALTTDTNSLINKYNYSLIQLGYELNQQTAALEAVSALADSYQRDATLYIPSGETVIKVGSNSGETYDQLISKKVALENSISAINADILDYTNRIADISGDKNNTINYTTLKMDLQSINDQLTEVKADFAKLAAAYNEKYIITGSIATGKTELVTGKLISGSFAILCIECCGPFCAIAVIAILIAELLAVIKKSKEPKAQAVQSSEAEQAEEPEQVAETIQAEQPEQTKEDE